MFENWREGLETPFSKLVTGVVADNADKEHKGLLKVRIPTLEEGEDLLERVRVLQPYAGAGAGMYFWPEVGDLVLVALIDGDMGRAFVLGSVYAPGAEFSDGCFHEENSQKSLCTRGGVRADFSDESGKESLTVSTPKKLSASLQDEAETITVTGESGETSFQLDMKNGKALLKAEKEIELVCGKSRIKMEKNGTVTVSGEKVVVTGKNVEASGKSKVKLSGQEITAEGQISVKISGQSQLELSSGGITQVKGGMLKLNG